MIFTTSILESLDKSSEIQRIAESLLLRIKLQQDATDEIEKLASLSEGALSALSTDEDKKAFWINIYNAYFLILAKNGTSRKKLFALRTIIIAGSLWTLDEIEHGILRRNKIRISFGYVTNPFCKKKIKKHMLRNHDSRIHFALNCGVKGCPPIAVYNPTDIQNQLHLATEAFIETDTLVDDAKKTLFVSRLFFWYNGDFGGNVAIRALHSHHKNKDLRNYKIEFRKYDFTEYLDNFTNFQR